MPRLLVCLSYPHAPIDLDNYEVEQCQPLEAVRILATTPAAIVTDSENLAAYAQLVSSARRLDAALPHDPVSPKILPQLGPAAPLLRLIALHSPTTALLATRAIQCAPAFDAPTTVAQAIVAMIAATTTLSADLQLKINAYAPLAELEKQQVETLPDTARAMVHGSTTLMHALDATLTESKIAIRFARSLQQLAPSEALDMVRAHYPTQPHTVWLRLASVMDIETPDQAPGTIEVSLDDIRAGDCLAIDLINGAGHLVAKKGWVITPQFLRHKEAQDYGVLPSAIIVYRPSAS